MFLSGVTNITFSKNRYQQILKMLTAGKFFRKIWKNCPVYFIQSHPTCVISSNLLFVDKINNLQITTVIYTNQARFSLKQVLNKH